MTAISSCPCTPNIAYQDCCGRYHAGATPSTAQVLMRSRYSAYVTHNIEFIKSTTVLAQQAQLDMQAIAEWSQNSQWLGLEVLSETVAQDQRHATVEFIAHWHDAQGRQQHKEVSLFIKLAERWYFYDPNVPLKAERNAPCPCGSTLKFKKCCTGYF